MHERECTLQKLEAAGRAMWSRGLCNAWLHEADADVARVSSTVNGLMMEDLCSAVRHDDAECVELFRKGMRVA